MTKNSSFTNRNHSTRVTPLRQQYLDIKAQHTDAILFFRLGDFYELFDADAEIGARELDMVLTSRPVNQHERVPMAGVPFHAIDRYAQALADKGYKVAICEVTGEDEFGRVKRAVTRTLKPKRKDAR